MTIACVLILCVVAVLIVLSRRKYTEYIDPLDNKRYPLKKLLPVGLYIMDIIRFKNGTRYDKRLLTKIVQLNGPKYAQYYLRIHWANKLTFTVMGLAVISALGLLSGTDSTLLIFGIVMLAVVFYLMDKKLDDVIKKRDIQIRMEFPDFLNKMTLLVNAGMSVSRAWEKIVHDNRRQDSYLYDEMTSVIAEIKAGRSEYQAYEDFAKRCRSQEITRFVSVIIQNLKKGNTDTVSILRLQANDCWEGRKNAAKKLGEEASTKMLFPMMLMFAAVLLIVVIPAALAMQGI